MQWGETEFFWLACSLFVSCPTFIPEVHRARAISHYKEYFDFSTKMLSKESPAKKTKQRRKK
jgi:hypothetical protein